MPIPRTKPPSSAATGDAVISLEQVARNLADRHDTESSTAPVIASTFYKRLEAQRTLLPQARNRFRADTAAKVALSYGAEWLLDNYYLLVQAMRQVGEDLPASYLRELPRLQTDGPSHGYPRVLDMARVLTLHENATLDQDRIVTFIAAYQEVQPLAMGELWAFPIMLRVVLLESVTQATARLTGLLDLDDGSVPPAFALDYGINDDDIVAAAIPALHRLSRIDWREFFEELSLVEQILGQDPAGLYGEMTFATRDRYRKIVESLALAVGKSEPEVARQVLALAKDVPCPDGEAGAGRWAGINLPRELHVGYYLLAGGRRELEAALGYQPGRKIRLQRWLLDRPTFVYLGAISIVASLLLGLILAYGARVEATLPQFLLIALLAFIPLISVSVSLVNWAVTTFVSPRILPKLDFSEGVPAASRTMVVVPAMLTSADEAESLLGQLERHYLRNPDPMLSFALLTDYGDAEHETMPDDEALLATAREGIARLSAHYPGAPFYIFHRRRLWNSQEEAWMGWERKRGKLHEFNQLLRGAQDTSFILGEGQPAPPSAVRYVITLDADTILSRDAAARLVGTLAHPLNRARFDEDGQVADGYTVLQPRTEIQPVSANQSLFTRVFAGDTGIDLYTLAVSDVYQDLFGEGIFVGKGIYDVDAFEQSVAGRIPENTLLSHDLFEGVHGRAGLVSDIVLYEDYPPHYLMQVRRNHRWVRGDWQLLPWLLPRVPVAYGGREPNRLTLIDRWKIVDNLRRSLYPLVLLLFFVAGWTALPGAPAFWTLVGLLIPGVNLATTFVGGLAGLLQGGSIRAFGRGLRDGAVRWLLFLAFLPYEALLNLDAILTTVRRVYFTRRHLLHWTTAAHTVRLFGEEVTAEVTWRDMVSSLFISLWIGLVVLLYQSDVLAAALPLLLLWLFAPQLAYWISRPARERKVELSPADERRLRRLARRTWFFYERFVGPDDHWLPPDHFQEVPRGVVARRTSPTNVGLYLLSAIAAYDFGYLDPLNFALRLRSAFDTLAQLDRYRGHFLNWIDTATLAPLPPRYVSTVDSGNLAGSLIALRQACLWLPQQPAWRWARWQGFLDNLDLLRGSLSAWRADLEPVDALVDLLDKADGEVLRSEDDPRSWYPLLRQLQESWHPAMTARLVEVITHSEGSIDSHTLQDCRLFAERLDDHLQAMDGQVALHLPWLPALREAPATVTGASPATLTAGAWEGLQEILVDQLPTAPVEQITVDAAAPLAQLRATLAAEPEAAAWLRQLEDNLRDARLTAHAFEAGFAELARLAGSFVDEMDFSFLYDRDRKIFHIGFNLDANRLDNNYYDLLASEARIASLVAIAKHDVPNNHWLHLSRPITATGGGYTLLSWSGTMFEYLMPPLLMRSYSGTLLDHSERQAVQTQIGYGRRRGVPWGVSESGFYTFDAALNYQYRAFGVPGLGLKRGLGEDLVISPYASLLALPIQPQAVLRNMDQLERRGMLGRYGFYEAIDFTGSRLDISRDFAIVQSYMAHHQGMIMLALANHLHDYPMVSRFHADPRIQAVELLLQEQLPQAATLETSGDEPAGEPVAAPGHDVAPWSVPLESPFPLVHYLSNGEYGVLFTNAGGGYSHWGDLMLTRWRPDVTRDHWGQWLYLQDEDNGTTWSAGLQPTGVEPDRRAAKPEIMYHPHMVELHRRDNDITLRMEIVVPPDANVEIRRVTVDNDSDEMRQLRLTTYAEVALAEQSADWRHPAFAKLFVESEYLEQYHALIFRRRPRASSEAPRYMAHMLVFSGANDGGEAHESDRARFLGRGRTAREPAALDSDRWLTGTTGATLDPVMALGQRFMLEPRQRARVLVLTAAASSREELLALLAHYQSPAAVDHAFAEARTRAERQLRRLEIETPDLQLAQRILSLLFYPHHVRRAATEILAANEMGQSGLWPFAISGDNPLLLVTIGDEEAIDLVQMLIRFHSYWRRLGLLVDLVILNTETAGYAEAVQGAIYRSLRRLEADSHLNRRGGIFVLKQDQLAPADRRLLFSAARVVLAAGDSSLAGQLDVLATVETPLPAFTATVDPGTLEEVPPLARPADLQFDNHYGGFSPASDEYVIYLPPGTETPAPWVNVVANETLGFLASETGGGYTWALNSGENRLTAWRNDPVTDLPAEAIYLRDEETAEIWSPAPQPAPAPAPYLVRHGAGYTIFEHDSHGLHHELRLFIAPDEPVKILELRLENRRQRVRRLTATFYAEPVLGTYRGITQQYLIPRYDPEHHALLVRNPYQVEFGERVAFFATNKEPHGLTADRTKFLGRLGSLQHPAALGRIGLDDRVAAGRDICAALQLHVELPPGGAETIYFLVGQGTDLAESERLLAHYRDPEAVRAAWNATRTKWDEILGAVQVKTPDPAMDLLLNRWLLYQALSCRIWGRSALYQSSGAYGFRDQLQDVMALVHSRPDLARAHILRAAAHQFEAGDVLHWWHPPSGRGVRTRISDDLLWLPFVTADYVATTGDTSVLDEKIPFLRGEPLGPDEEERYGEYEVSAECFTVLEHCQRALRRGSTSGPHNLPLMGGGDWNDGMNRVGHHGRGESVWLAWFLEATLTSFAALCERVGEDALAADYRRQAGKLREAIETSAWDGSWYLRAWYDDGTPLGSRQNRECQIDAIAQSWGVLSGAADPARVRQAMQSVRDHLVREEDRLLLLFTPPFNTTPQDPGYIKGYLPGIRENGGQYTHAALWTIWAFAQLGDGAYAESLFRLTNPIYRAATQAGAEQYKVEPYVVAADVYGVSPHEGRGGWTWYTGSSGWMYRLGLEGILGLRRENGSLRLQPRIPPDWPGFAVRYWFGGTIYEISVDNEAGGSTVVHVELDGEVVDGPAIPLIDDGAQHDVRVRLGQEEPQTSRGELASD